MYIIYTYIYTYFYLQTAQLKYVCYEMLCILLGLEIYNELDNSSHLQIVHSIILYGFLRCENQGT